MLEAYKKNLHQDTSSEINQNGNNNHSEATTTFKDKLSPDQPAEEYTDHIMAQVSISCFSFVSETWLCSKKIYAAIKRNRQ